MKRYFLILCFLATFVQSESRCVEQAANQSQREIKICKNKVYSSNLQRRDVSIYRKALR